VPRFFFLLSGEHPSLPFAELRSALDAEDIAYSELQTLPQILRLNTAIKAVDALRRRAALTRVCCREIFHAPASTPEILRAAKSAPIDSFLHPGESFVVRVRRIGEKTSSLTSISLERKLGELILDRTEKTRVNLEDPRRIFFGAITGGYFVLGLRINEIPATPFMQRRPRKRPFFHPSAMPPKLARCMVNLAKAKEGDVLLDPFCGTGSFLIEAALLGCRVVGSDAKRYVVRGCRRNLRHFRLEWEGLVAADARCLPIAGIDCVVTDPPYGRSATTMGCTTERVVSKFLANAVDAVHKGQRVCLAAPQTINVGKIATSLGYQLVESHLVYVHRSLTREVAVLEAG
jgi:tRNA (guanine10-N2)-dimethyltransferase